MVKELDYKKGDQRVMIKPKPSSQLAQEPDMPPIVYPRGGMSVCLKTLVNVQMNSVCEPRNLPAAPCRVSKPVALPSEAGQYLNAVNPEPGPQ